MTAAAAAAKKRKSPAENFDISSIEDVDTSTDASQSDIPASALEVIMKQLGTMTSTAAATKIEETNWKLLQNEVQKQAERGMSDLSGKVTTMGGKVDTLQSDVNVLRGRLCA